MNKDDPYKPPRIEGESAQAEVVIESPGFWWQLGGSLWSSGTSIAISAILLPDFIRRIWWTILIPMAVAQIIIWYVQKQKSEPVLRELRTAPPESDGQRILCAGAFRGKTGEGSGKSFWGPVYLTGDALILGKGQFAEHIPLAEVKKVTHWGDLLRLHLKDQKKVSVHLLNEKKWRARIKAALATVKEKVPPGVAAAGEPRGLQ